MKFTEDLDKSKNTITGYEKDCIYVNNKIIKKPFTLAPDALVLWEAEAFTDFNNTHIDQIEALKPEVIIIGTGEKHLFLDHSLLKKLVALGIGYEIMTTSAACRTYNILISEDRRVVAALFQ